MTIVTPCPFLNIICPKGTEKCFYLSQKRRYTLGRLSENDLTLDDPQKKISRYHCAIEWDKGYWWVIDEGSANGTFVRHEDQNTEIDVRCQDRIKLQQGDIILILGQLSQQNEPIFWQLTFNDPEQTRPVPQFYPVTILEYSLPQQRLWRVNVTQREEISLTTQEQKLIHYMAQRNYEHQQQEVVCQHQELIEAIWGDSFGHISNEITRLVWGLRNKIETDSGEPRFLQTVRGQGYRLAVKVLS